MAMRIIRSELLILKRTFLQIQHVCLKSRSSYCAFYNPLNVYNKQTNKISRYSITGITRSIVSKPVIYIEGEEKDVDVILGHSNIRFCLDKDYDDNLTHKINKCASVDQVFSIVNEEFDNITSTYACQLILVMWDLFRIYKESYLQNLVNDDVESSPESMLISYLDQLQKHDDFKKILQVLDANCDNLTLDEASCCLLYLKQMGVPLTEPIMDRLVQMCLNSLDESEENLPGLRELTRITAALEPKLNSYYLSFGRKVLPITLQYLDNCKTPEELRLITYILDNIQLLIVTPILDRYKSTVKHLIETGVLGQKEYQILLDVADFLSFTGWSRNNFAEVREICDIVAPEIKNMDATNISELHKIFQTILEPSHILQGINKRAGELVTAMIHDERLGTCLKLPHILHSYVTYSPPEKRNAFELLISQYSKKLFPSTLLSFYRTLRHLKMPNVSLCDNFWGRAVHKIVKETDDEHLLFMFCHKYLYFTNVGQIYRNLPFERLMIEKVINKFREGYVTLFPKKLAKMSAFLIAYGFNGYTINYKEMEQIVSHVEKAREQLDAVDCLVISRGLQMCSILNSKRKMKQELTQLLNRMYSVVTQQTQYLGKNNNISIHDLKCLVKCHILKKNYPNIELTYDLVKKYSKIPDRKKQLNSIVIRDTSYNLLLCKVVVPSLFEEMESYLVQAKSAVLGETAHKVLSLFYNLGYEVKSKEMFETCGEVFDRDKHAMSSLSLLQACCALCFYNQLPETLIKYIFSIQFMERLDNEIAMCYQQWIYPQRVRWQLMHLNRCVCIEYPQHRVPWFHQKYLQEKIAFAKLKKTHFDKSVLDTFKSIWPQSLVKASHFSPYGYKMNLCVTLDENGTVTTPYSQDVRRKVSVILLEKDDFCKVLKEDDSSDGQYQTVLNGLARHRQRHLEMLGYKTLQISPSMWFSMHMTDEVKKDYLKEQILER